MAGEEAGGQFPASPRHSTTNRRFCLDSCIDLILGLRFPANRTISRLDSVKAGLKAVWEWSYAYKMCSRDTAASVPSYKHLTCNRSKKVFFHPILLPRV